MQHDVLPLVLEALSDLDAGDRRPAPGGLWVVPLAERTAEEATNPRSVSRPPAGGSIIWSEFVPPDPARVQAQNVSMEPVVVEAGAVLRGGMSGRAVLSTRRVPPAACGGIAVEAIGARWWDDGPLQVQGRLAPVGLALLLQAAYGEAGVRCSARTAVWGLPDLDMVSDPIDDPIGSSPASGWVVVSGNDVLAALLPRRSRATPGRPHAVAERREPDRRTRLVTRILEDVARGDLAAHFAGDDHAGREVILVRHDLRLVDCVIAASAAQSR